MDVFIFLGALCLVMYVLLYVEKNGKENHKSKYSDEEQVNEKNILTFRECLQNSNLNDELREKRDKHVSFCLGDALNSFQKDVAMTTRSFSRADTRYCICEVDRFSDVEPQLTLQDIEKHPVYKDILKKCKKIDIFVTLDDMPSQGYVKQEPGDDVYSGRRFMLIFDVSKPYEGS
ncbi:MAG: hypothetical protein OSB62_00265 [Alphaproteobacteria bacterium]|nr:hypothetical protein [Alphaproteobacteria bacterium]